jgi:peptide/nickel transport system substrate-binding protein
MGTGPYKLISFNPETGVFLESSETYAGAPPAFRKVNMRVVVDTAARVNGLKAGEIDTAAVLDVQDLKQLEEDPDLVVGVKPSTRVQIIRFNTLIKPMDDVRVRKAINYAINKEAITKALFRGLVSPAASQILTTLHDGYNTDLKPWPYDPDKAKQLLAEAGYPNGFDVEMVYGKGTYVGAELAAQVVVGQLARVGIRAKLNIIPASLHAQRAATDQQAAMTWFGYADTATVASETLTYLGSTHNQTRGPVPAAYDAAVQAARSALTTEAEMAAVKTATQVAADEAMAVFLWDLPQTFAESKKVVWNIRRDDWTLPSDVRPA